GELRGGGGGEQRHRRDRLGRERAQGGEDGGPAGEALGRIARQHARGDLPEARRHPRPSLAPEGGVPPPPPPGTLPPPAPRAPPPRPALGARAGDARGAEAPEREDAAGGVGPAAGPRLGGLVGGGPGEAGRALSLVSCAGARRRRPVSLGAGGGAAPRQAEVD